MDEMDGYYHWNKISFCPKYIQWTRLSDKSEMIYSKKSYRKPVDEIKLLAHIKRTILTNNRGATQKRKKQKSESPQNDELFKKVRNNNVYTRSL
jgi:hypothetical protein